MDMITTGGDLMKPMSSMAAFGRGSAEAMMKSGQIWTAGCQAIAKAMTVTAQGNFERTMAAWQALSHVKSPKEAMDIQTSFAQISLKEACAETSKLVEATTKLARDAMAPITDRLTHAEEKASGLMS